MTTKYPVDSTTRTCCGGIGRHSRECHPDVPIPAGTTVSSDFEEYGDDCRSVAGANRPIGDSSVSVWTAAEQGRDGTVGRGRVGIDDGRTQLLTIFPAAARALAATLIEAADELDGWQR